MINKDITIITVTLLYHYFHRKDDSYPIYLMRFLVYIVLLCINVVIQVMIINNLSYTDLSFLCISMLYSVTVFVDLLRLYIQAKVIL